MSWSAAVQGLTPLHTAALSGQNAIVRMLLLHGADPNATDHQVRPALFNTELTQDCLHLKHDLHKLPRSGPQYPSLHVPTGGTS